MRSLMRMSPALLLAGLLTGCGQKEPEAAKRPHKEVQAEVVLSVPGMT